MRIIGYLPSDKYKITVFQMNGKLSVKIEHQLLEQTYKFRDGSLIKTMNDIERLINGHFLKEVDTLFKQMENLKYKALDEHISEEEQFDEII